VTYVDEPPGEREIHERKAPLYLAEFRRGPLDGIVEVREGVLPKTVVRRWYSMTAGGPVNHYLYELREPVEGLWIEYDFIDLVYPKP
jgi:hypothetical protein